jgi:hypothetical protein
MRNKSHFIAIIIFFSLFILFTIRGKSQGNSGSVKVSKGKNTAPELVSDSIKTALGLDLPAQARIKMNQGKNKGPVHDSLPPDPAENIPANMVISNKKQQ